MFVFKVFDFLLDKIISPLVAILGVFVALSFIVGIVARSFLGIALFGLEELILMAVIWFYMLGAILASKDGSHLRADFIPVVVKNENVILLFSICATLVSIAMAILFVSWSNALFQWALQRGNSTPVFSIPLYASQASLLLAAILMTLYLVRDLIKDIHSLMGRNENIVH